MIRQPTSDADAYAWWEAAIAGHRPPRYDGYPQAGFYKRRARRDAPWIPIEIRLRRETDPETGELTEPEEFEAVELGYSRDPVALWLSCRPIPREEFDELVHRHETMQVMAATHAPVDLSDTPILPGA